MLTIHHILKKAKKRSKTAFFTSFLGHPKKREKPEMSRNVDRFASAVYLNSR
jgi:hypothetical protein